MSSPLLSFFLIAVVDFILGGLISNGFIATVVLRDWTKKRSLASIEQLFLSLTLCNFWGTILIIVYYINYHVTFIFSKYVLLILYFTTSFLLLSRFWISVWLCVFYCIKIVNITHSIFLWWKLRISWLLPRLLLGSLTIPLVISSSSLSCVVPNVLSNTTRDAQYITKELIHNCCFHITKILLFTIGSGCPFLVVLLCSILVVASLCRHVCQMKSKDLHSRGFQSKAHIKAAGTVLFLFLLYLSFCVIQTLFLTIKLEIFQEAAIAVVLMFYPSFQACILLFINSRLNLAASQMLRRAKAEPLRMNIEIS